VHYSSANPGYFYMPGQYLTGSKLGVDSSPINHAHLASDFFHNIPPE
jgi:hypothetical protein